MKSKRKIYESTSESREKKNPDCIPTMVFKSRAATKI